MLLAKSSTAAAFHADLISSFPLKLCISSLTLLSAFRNLETLEP